jgi:hypothetical protein
MANTRTPSKAPQKSKSSAKAPPKKEKPGYMGFAIGDTVKKIKARKKMLNDI